MPLKYHGTGDDPTVVERWSDGLTWMAHPTEEMQRASHALVSDEGVWLVDPLDAAGLDEVLAPLGPVAGVVVLTNSHGRHADRVARRHDVAVYVPDCFDRDAHPVAGFEAPVEPIADRLADTGFELVWEKDASGWKEGALYHSERRTLVIPDTLMTSLFVDSAADLGVFPFFQLSPPRAALGDLDVDRVLVGHGEPVVEDARAALEDALDTTRLGAASAIVGALPTFARIAYHEARS